MPKIYSEQFKADAVTLVSRVEIATFEWVNWQNQIRLHQVLDYRTPVEVNNEYWHITNVSEKIKTRANA